MRRSLSLICAVAALLAFAIFGAPWPARAGDITYPNLTAATTVQDTDLIATWRASGPLTKVQASVLNAYIQGKLSPLFLNDANNLSDLANVGTARANLGLGTAATQNTGTSGVNLCLMNANCTWSGTETFSAAVSMGSTLNVTGLLTASAGVAGNASTASKWQTARTETLSGDVSGSASVDGSGNWTIGSTLAASGVGAGSYGSATSVPVITFDAKGRATSASSVSIASGSQSGSLYTSNGSAPSWTPRLSAYFSGCSTSGCTFVSGVGITGVTRAGIGNYSVGFSQPMPDGNYTVICTSGANGAGYSSCVDWSCPNNGCTHPTGGVEVAFFNAAGSQIDPQGGFNILIIHN